MSHLTDTKITRFSPGDDFGDGWESPIEAQAVVGSSAFKYTPGDFILTHSNSLTGRLIRLGQWFRYGNATYKRWSHAALIVSEQGDLIEAVGRGILSTPISHYRSTERYLVHLSAATADKRDREQIVEFARYWLAQKPRYGCVTIVSVAFSLITSAKFVFGIDGQFTCSGLVASALERTATIFDHSSANMLPADLAKHFNVCSPPDNTSKGVAPKPNL
jgi:hypothetical protein